jgi:hypothetical protein
MFTAPVAAMVQAHTAALAQSHGTAVAMLTTVTK